jgi:hypothetical protein
MPGRGWPSVQAVGLAARVWGQAPPQTAEPVPWLRERYEREAQTLVTLTGWNIGEIRKSMNIASLPISEEKKWYQQLWAN